MKKLLTVFAVLLICIAALAISASAAVVEEGICGADVTWKLDDKGVLTIEGSGSGHMAGYSGNGYPWYPHKDSIVKVVIKDGVTNIANSAFAGAGGYWEIKEVVISPSVTSIGDEAFKGCKALTDVTFTGTSKLTTIGRQAFYSCSSLERITIPASVTTLGASALAYNGKLAEVVFEPGSKLTVIGFNNFERNEALTEITIPAQTETIGSRAFWLCTSLKKVTFAPGSKLKTLEYGAFQDCSALQTINLPEGLTTIENNVFRMCGKLENVTIPTTVTTIGDAAFLLIWGTQDYSNSLDVTIPKGSKLESIGERAFAGCEGKMDINLPSTLTTLSSWAFGYCTGLTEIYLPASLTTLGDNAFEYCENLTDVAYGGSKSAWAELNADNSARIPEDATIRYNVSSLSTPSVSVSIKTANGKPQLKWKAVEGATKYEIWRAVGKNSGYSKIYTMTGTTYVNTSAKAGTTYYYKVRAVGEGEKSGFSTAKYITCDCAQPVVTVKLNADDKPRLSWEKVTGASKYEIWRAEGKDSGYKKIYTMTGNVFTNSSAKEGVTYYYKVRAVCGVSSYGNSAFSTAKSVTVPLPLSIVSQPENASAALGGKAKFSVEAEGVGLKYQWQYCTAKGTKWTNTTLTGNKTDTLTVGATSGRNGYKYRCVITDVNGDSVTSDYGVLTVE